MFSRHVKRRPEAGWILAVIVLTGGTLGLRAQGEDVGRQIPAVRGKAGMSPQAAPLTSRVIPYVLDSGPLDNPTDEPKVVFDHTVFLGNEVSWVRVLFADANLPKGSFIRLTSMYDGEYQTLDDQSLRNWGNSSAYFNGPAVRVELIAAAISDESSFRLDRIMTGERRNALDLPVGGANGICGNSDGRSSSTDARVARLFTLPGQEGFIPQGCEETEFETGTAFIIDIPTFGSNQRLHASVGHAWALVPTGGAIPYTVLQFNVPPSETGSGAICHPSVCDQFPIDLNEVIHSPPVPPLGAENDWAIFRCHPHQVGSGCSIPETSYERSGLQAFPLGPIPPFGTQVRVTGYGRDFTETGGGSESCGCTVGQPGCTSSTNRTQQVAEGPVVDPMGNGYASLIHFQVDACNGNSGSPLSAPIPPGVDSGASAVGIFEVDRCAAIDIDPPFNAAVPFSNLNLQRAICHLADYETNDVTISGNVLTIVPNPIPPAGEPFALRVSGDPRQPVAAAIDLFVQSDLTLGSAPHFANWPPSVQVNLSVVGCGIQYAVERVFQPTSNRLNECIENYRIPGTTATTVSAEGSRYIAISSPCTNLAYRVVGEPGDSQTSCVNRFVQSNGTLGPNPYYGPWSTSIIHVHGAEIIPNKSNTIQTMPGPSGLAPVQSWQWGDTNNTGGDIDLDDLLCLLAAFAQDFDACGYGIEASDMMGCTPDGGIDIDDLTALLSAFASEPYICAQMPCSTTLAPGPNGPEGPSGFGGEGFSQCTISLDASSKQIAPGATKTVEGYIDCPTPLNGNQLALQVTGGTIGTLTLESISINDNRTDYGFYSLPHVPAIDVSGARMADALYSGGVAFTPEKYAASFVFRASTNSSGTFTVSLRPNETHLRDENRAPVNWENGGSVYVTVSPP